MVEKEKGKGDMANWEMSKTGDEIDDDLSGPVRFFDVSSAPQGAPLSDDDQTPIVNMVRKNTVVELDVAQIQAALQAVQKASSGVRQQQYQDRQERLDKARRVEMDEIFRAVATGEEDQIKSLFTRDIGMRQFRDEAGCELFIESLLGGENEMGGILDMKKMQAGAQRLAEITFEMRVAIGKERPLVEITLVNKVGQGRRQGENVTIVSSVKIKENIHSLAPLKSGEKLTFLEKLLGRKK